jgi:hypothetical protein
MPATTKGTRGNVGEIGNELAKRHLLTKIEQLHYRAYKKNVITLQTVLNYSPRLAEYMKSYEKK